MASLTEVEKEAIKNSWALVAGDLKGHGVNMLVQYLKDFPDHRIYFRAYGGLREDSLRASTKFRTHANLIMYSLSCIVENLDDPGCFKELMKRHVFNHQPRKIGSQEYKDMFATVIKTLQLGLRDKCTPLVKASWRKALETIGQSIDEEMERLGSVRDTFLKAPHTRSSIMSSRHYCSSIAEEMNEGDSFLCVLII